MRNRKEYEELEQKFLASYAMKSAESEGREFSEEEHPFRTCFQRDRDRIIHSNAFRRLEYKTQVFVYHEGDHYRTRLTHSIEGSQIARTITRALCLNEDLAEAIILAHDLGHTPFGHSGEVVLNRLMKEHGGYEHNRQSLRIVTLLEERYPEFPGLNLTYEVREGLAKHQTTYDQPNAQANIKKKGNPTLEAQIVNLADEIAYTNHDLDDGLRSGLITLEQLKEVALWQEHFEREKGKEKIRIRQTVKSVINAYVTDLVTQTEENLQSANIKNISEVRSSKAKLATLSEKFDPKSRELKGFLREKMYKHYRVERMADKAERILENLFKTYLKNPKILPPEVYEKVKKGEPERTICDYIAGMTDRFALDEYNKLFDPHEKV
jgi:dGTPase